MELSQRLAEITELLDQIRVKSEKDLREFAGILAPLVAPEVAKIILNEFSKGHGSANEARPDTPPAPDNPIQATMLQDACQFMDGQIWQHCGTQRGPRGFRGWFVAAVQGLVNFALTHQDGAEVTRLRPVETAETNVAVLLYRENFGPVLAYPNGGDWIMVGTALRLNGPFQGFLYLPRFNQTSARDVLRDGE